ncbi:MAG: N-6 DNA methylase [Cyanobacteria bacterium P01_D01_bin.156]
MVKPKNLNSIAACKVGFKEVFTVLTRKHNYSEAWADFAIIGAICAHQTAYFNPSMVPSGMEDHSEVTKARESLLPIDDDWKALENRYLAFVPKYGKEGMTLMSQLYGYTDYALNVFGEDFLGALYEELDLSGSAQRGSRGEFFTPSSVAKMMAQMSLADVEDIIDRKGFITLSEPCCGAGGMVIAFANALKELGHNPQEILYVEAIDVNQTFFNIAYMQLALLGLPCRVWCANTLSLEVNEFRETPHLKLSRYHWEKQPAFHLLRFLRQMERDVGQKTSEKGLPKAETESIPMPTHFEQDDRGQFTLF